MHQWIVRPSILLFIINAISNERRRDAFECDEIRHQKCKVDSFDIPFYQNCEVEIMPHIMLSSDVFFKRDVFIVEGFPFQAY